MKDYSKYLGVPFKNMGRSFKGIDCYGLVWLIFKEERGIELPDFTDLGYELEWRKKGQSHILENITEDWSKVDAPFKIFDCHIFTDGKIASHIGLNIGHDKFIHIFEFSIVVINRLESWLPRLHCTLRYRDGKDNF